MWGPRQNWGPIGPAFLTFFFGYKQIGRQPDKQSNEDDFVNTNSKYKEDDFTNSDAVDYFQDVWIYFR